MAEKIRWCHRQFSSSQAKGPFWTMWQCPSDHLFKRVALCSGPWDALWANAPLSLMCVSSPVEMQSQPILTIRPHACPISIPINPPLPQEGLMGPLFGACLCSRAWSTGSHHRWKEVYSTPVQHLHIFCYSSAVEIQTMHLGCASQEKDT